MAKNFLTEENFEKLNNVIEEHKDMQGPLMPILHGAQHIFGAIPTFTTREMEGEDGKKKKEKVFDSIRYWNIEKPETIRVIWKDENFAEIGGFIKQYRISVAMAEKMFAEEIAASKVRIVADFNTDNAGDPEPTDVPMCTVKEYWDENEYLLMFNADNKPVHYMKHDWNYIPLQYVPNIHLPGEPKGTSDIEHELDPQQEYNERASDMADIIKEISRPATHHRCKCRSGIQRCTQCL